MVKISTMTGKLKGLKAINTNTVTNPFCHKMHYDGRSNVICRKCYSHYMLETYRKNCQSAFEHNSQVLSKRLDEIPNLTCKEQYIRFHAHGELLNRQHYLNFIDIARANPEKTFALWTKRINLTKGIKRPKNMILIYSNPYIDKHIKKPMGFDKVFTVYSDASKANINCGAKSCITCKLCYTKNRTVYVNEILK